MEPFATRYAAAAADAAAPDGSEVRLLCATSRGSMARFTLPPGAVAKAVAHRSVEEVWYVIAGRGRMWRCAGGQETVTELAAGLSLAIPVGVQFQFRCDGPAPLEAVAVTMPPWPGPEEAYAASGPWQATV